jgi:hypothetical protein
VYLRGSQYTNIDKLHEKKTGSVRIAHGKDLTIDERLPEGQIRWGFLYLDPSNGRFEIDQKMVDSHVSELQRQLQGQSKSVINWIQVWNSYAATFFSSNFGKPSNCFGREHVDKILATHRHIEKSVFGGGSVVSHLKSMISERFNVTDVPEGFLYFPVELGGLDLKSPFVPLLQIRYAVHQDPYSLLTKFVEQEKDDYAAAKKRYDEGGVRTLREHTPDATTPKDTDPFMSLDEFTKYRASFDTPTSWNIRNTFQDLLLKPTETPAEPSVAVRQALSDLRGHANLRGITSEWSGMDAYWKWVAQMYGPQILERFGGMNLVDRGMIPVGMVGYFRGRRTNWQG